MLTSSGAERRLSISGMWQKSPMRDERMRSAMADREPGANQSRSGTEKPCFLRFRNSRPSRGEKTFFRRNF